MNFDVNVIGVINTVNTFISLLRKVDTAIAALYSISKATLHVAVAKCNALYKSEGILFMAISPGLVDTGGKVPNSNNAKEVEAFHEMQDKFAAYAPHFKAATAPQESVNAILKLFEKSSIENGDGGTFVSHLGNKQWL